jgi:hypothetical protein
MLQSYFHTARYIVLDSGFCVLKGIIELRKNGLFGCALIKKRRYWPAGVPGDAMLCDEDDGDGWTVGGVRYLQGGFAQVDGRWDRGGSPVQVCLPL